MPASKTEQFQWGCAQAPLHFDWSDASPVRVGLSGAVPDSPDRPGMAEVLVLGEGRALTSLRMDRTAVGRRLRHDRHRVCLSTGVPLLNVTQDDADSGLSTVTRFAHYDDLPAYRVTTTVMNSGKHSCVLQGVASVVLRGLTGWLGPACDIDLWTASNEWCAENRWGSTALMGPDGLADINPAVHGHSSRCRVSRCGQSTWSSGSYVPTAALVNRVTGRTLIWDVENNGPWQWEIDAQEDDADALSLVLAGPEDLDHAWSVELAPREAFETVPASFALGDSLQHAVGILTAHRRRSRLPFTADAARPLIFNDYMNTLMGDPTRDKLLPLIDAAAGAGAQVFCIDAGWYDDSDNWWPSVGAWTPSTVRFGDQGLGDILVRIRERGMIPGLWVEPEVVGVSSPVASQLPDDAFMTRHGRRIVEHSRYFLDLRSGAARGFLDDVFDRLVGMGAGYFKLDYNVTPGSGPDASAFSPGAGLLDHTRAHLRWFEALRNRHTGVIFEACSSGAQRMDQAILQRFDLQSTSDQQDYRLYPTIAAAAPMAMAPEQAGNWAYPSPGWTDEQIAFNLVTGLSGRLYLSGHLDRLSDHQLALVRQATALYPAVMAHRERSMPQWPLGLPAWDDAMVAVAGVDDAETWLAVWQRDASVTSVDLRLPQYAGRPVRAEIVFPVDLAEWPMTWAADDAMLRLDLSQTDEAARLIRVQPV